MPSAHAGIVFPVSTKQADAAEVQGARLVLPVTAL